MSVSDNGQKIRPVKEKTSHRKSGLSASQKVGDLPPHRTFRLTESRDFPESRELQKVTESRDFLLTGDFPPHRKLDKENLWLRNKRIKSRDFPPHRKSGLSASQKVGTFRLTESRDFPPHRKSGLSAHLTESRDFPSQSGLSASQKVGTFRFPPHRKSFLLTVGTSSSQTPLTESRDFPPHRKSGRDFPHKKSGLSSSQKVGTFPSQKVGTFLTESRDFPPHRKSGLSASQKVGTFRLTESRDFLLHRSRDFPPESRDFHRKSGLSASLSASQKVGQRKSMVEK
ncbi:hypothetical protein Baya_15053 [Bagarius yarrelli]|uniref:Uncharacterized protein n=1 Tax=Bagarius yarrelli TaxID=175774 RepID=A0A556VB69_BAGYA|nr:hypothetical protein Baya_15053 [Bagarius yarrelli]